MHFSRDWQSVSVNGVTLAQSIYCWENNFEKDKCLITTSSSPRYSSIEGKKKTDKIKTNSGGNSKQQVKCQNQKLKPIKRFDNNCHNPDMVQTFSYDENSGFIDQIKLYNKKH